MRIPPCDSCFRLRDLWREGGILCVLMFRVVYIWKPPAGRKVRIKSSFSLLSGVKKRMATWNADAIIGLLFIPCYTVLFCFNVYNCKLHGIRKEAGYVCLIAVSVCMKPTVVLLIVSENRRRYLDDDILDWDIRLSRSCNMGCQSSTTRILPPLHRNTGIYSQMVSPPL